MINQLKKSRGQLNPKAKGSQFSSDRSGGAPRSAAEFAYELLGVDIYRFERYALTVINQYDHKILVSDGKPYLLERGVMHCRAVYDQSQLANVANEIVEKFNAVEIRQLKSKDQELLIAARIALALPELRRALQSGDFSPEFVSGMCRISAAVPDPDAATRLLNQQHRKISGMGGSSKKTNIPLQNFINEIVKKLSKKGSVSAKSVWNYLVRHYSDSCEDVDNLTDFDNPHIEGDKLYWTDRQSKIRDITSSSLRRYVARAKSFP